MENKIRRKLIAFNSVVLALMLALSVMIFYTVSTPMQVGAQEMTRRNLILDGMDDIGTLREFAKKCENLLEDAATEGFDRFLQLLLTITIVLSWAFALNIYFVFTSKHASGA